MEQTGIDNVIAKRLADAEQAKNDGSAALQAGNIKRASFLYKSVYLHLGDLVTPKLVEGVSGAASSDDGGMAAMVGQGRKKPKCTPEEQSAVDKLYMASVSNLALTHLKLGRPSEAIQCATRVLLLEPRNTKALFRRAKGRIQLGLLDEAAADLNAILEITPGDADTVATQNELALLLSQSKEKEKAMFKKMFS
ncbi:Hypothetical protein, putative [Bodo saltans]|uniref:peptidylprolyl isomerase n=1 Tax=Bodo saltans TaxID=75058 RepID=A0A0S4J1V3_BODSA|nr:Hypothetical protein, putative [Bodo saltans]|eukprot:CUG61601.1 Hypothetical protein, putative [Bodo saltans]